MYWLAALFFAIGGDGWFSVEKNPTATPEEVWEDSSIWPVFTKQMGKERFLIRFPADPTYFYDPLGELEVDAESDSEKSVLRVFPRSDDVLEKRVAELSSQPDVLLIQIEAPSSHLVDLQYFSQGKWVAERLVLTSEHLYLLQTSSEKPSHAHHQQFISSLDIQVL